VYALPTSARRCRFRYAELLADEGKTLEAAEQFRFATREMVWARIVFPPLLPAAILGRARALEILGNVPGALAAYERLTHNYARADHEVQEVIEARAALSRLGQKKISIPSIGW
jgi:hypothetical protein